MQMTLSYLQIMWKLLKELNEEGKTKWHENEQEKDQDDVTMEMQMHHYGKLL